MNLDRRFQLLGVVAALILVGLLAFAAGFVVTESGTTVESTVVTAQTGNVTAPGDSLVLVVRGDSAFADRVEERLETRLSEDGYAVAVARGIEGHEGQLLVVDIEQTEVDPGLVSHSADVTVESYYATDWNATLFEQYQETGVIEQRSPDQAVTSGEYAIRDRTSGVSTRYRRYVADLVVDAVADSFRGTIPR